MLLQRLRYKLRNRYQWHIGGWASRRSGRLARHVRWPVPGSAPWRWPTLEVARVGGIGDILMATPALREVKRLNPACRITFYSGYPDVLRGLPYIDEVRRFDEKPPHALVFCEGARYPRRHLAQVFGDCLGVEVTDVRPDCAADPAAVERWRARWSDRPRPVVVVNRRCNTATPNKDWADDSWVELIGTLCNAGMTVAEIGLPAADAGVVEHPLYEDYRGKTALAELPALLAAADLHVGPSSGPHHMAAAFGVPTVVIYGGFELPNATDYPGNVNLFTELPCSPCWLWTPCPYGKECLRRITPARVAEAVHELNARRLGRRPLNTALAGKNSGVR
jgi:ADP-heptose:LPS heptosyltransferase